MLGVRLSQDTEARLNALAQKTHRSKSYYVKRAIEEFLEDQEDYFLAVQAYEDFQKDPVTFTFEEIQEKYGLRKRDQH